MENPIHVTPIPVRPVFVPRFVVVVPVYPRPIRRQLPYPPPSPDFLLQKQIEELEDFKNLLATRDAYNSMPSLKFTWTFPCFNLLKLNTDGSSKGNPGPSSFGGLIRDCNGRWLRGYMGKMSGRHYTALEAEVWSIFKGLCLFKQMDLSFLLIETDCMAAVRLTMKELDNDHPMKCIMDAIKELMLEQRCTMIHKKRDGNHCADQLAKLGGKQSEEYMVLEEPPELLIPYMLRDIEAASDQFQRNSNHYC